MNEEILLLIWLSMLIIFIILYVFKFHKYFKNNDEKVLYLLFALTIFFSPPFVWFTVSIKSIIGFIYPEHIDAWIAFYGAIIGGALTLFGVWWTITDQNKKRKEDQELRDKEKREEMAIQYKPIITAEVVETSEIMGGIIKSKICIKNVGRGEANDLKFSIEQLNGNDYSLYPTTLSNDIYPVLQDNKYEFIFCKIDKTKPYSSNKMSGILPLEKKVYYFKSEISYKNPIDSKYLYILNMKLSLMKVVPKEEIPNIASINQKEPPPEIWELGIDTDEYSTFIVDKSATKDQEG